jgi:hypothetical protein
MPRSARPRRPTGVTLFALLVLTFAVLHLLRLMQTVQNWDLLAALLPISPVYLFLTGLLWAGLGFPLAWGVWRGWRVAYYLSPVILLGYTLYFWADRLLLSGFRERQENWPFAAALNIIILVWSLWVLTRPKARAYFGEKHEREPQNSTTA